MATTTITPLQLANDVFSVTKPITGETAIVAGNDHAIAYPQEGKLLIRIKNTYAGAKVITVESGDFIANGQGDLAQTFAQDEERFIVLSSDRFKDTDGNVIITVASGTTGYIGAYYMP